MNNRVQFIKTTTPLDIEITVVAFVKLMLRGIFNFSFMPKLYGQLCQVKIGDRVGVEMPNGDRVVAIRKSPTKAIIVSAYNKYKGDEVVIDRGLKLLNFLSFTLAKQKKINHPLTAMDISTEKSLAI